jgi:hypothetical protein
VLACDPAIPDVDSVRVDSAARILGELLEAVPNDGEGVDLEYERFQGALEALQSLGAVEYQEWDRRLRERLGWPSAEDEFEQDACPERRRHSSRSRSP